MKRPHYNSRRIKPIKLLGIQKLFPRNGRNGGNYVRTILKISQLTARVEEKEILHDINFEMRKGETHVLMGPNGAGKSTLGYVLMGNPKYEVTGGSISFKGKDITAESADKRAKDGMFLSFQEPLEVPGLSVSNFIRNALQQKKGGYVRLWDFKKELKKNLDFWIWTTLTQREA